MDGRFSWIAGFAFALSFGVVPALSYSQAPEGGESHPSGSSLDLVEDLTPKPPRSRSLNESKLISCDENLAQRSRGVGMEPVSKKVNLTVEFPSDSDVLTPEARHQLDALGEALRSPQLKRSCFWIEGHTDAQNTESYNLALSDRRARRVVRYLVRRHHIAEERLIAEGKGESEPLASNDTHEGRRQNRRVQVSNLGVLIGTGGS